ncbi:MAG TPA: SGNH/GDSL hydrolase family protein [Pseudorhodoplanes sp.]|nr:SGNH/GDSL hydrolase family protein [Pseudorhodoplanes sp.]
MTGIVFRPFLATAWFAGAAIAAAVPGGGARAEAALVASPHAPGSPVCAAPANLLHLAQPLPHLARRLGAGQPVRIVALGSSSTAGAGASSPANAYPPRLEAELRRLFPRAHVTVVNRGVNGEEASDMLARFDESVAAEKPDLVLWQVGSNAILRDYPLAPAAKLINQGVDRMKTIGADVVLIDPQFAPKVLAKVEVDDMVELIETAAKHANVNVFHRFALMRYWRQTARIPFRAMLSEDELHMNDWSYGCLAKLLAGSIAEAANRATVTATATAPAAR